MSKFTIAHLSDLHLGYSAGKKRIDENGYNVRENDGYVAYEKAVDEIIKEKVDMVLVAGDMFHSPRPKNHTIIIAQKGLRRLAAAGIKVYIIAGNHDATDVRAEIPSSQLLDEPANGIYSYSDPYVVKEIHPGIFMHFVSHHAYVDQQDTMSLIKLEEGAVNILASHGSCYDTNIGEILRTPNEPREVVIPEAIMELPWDYTFLGHIHERGWIGSKDPKKDTAGRKQFYNGSLLRRGFADNVSKSGRGWTKWTINEDNSFDCKMFTIPERPQFNMKAIDVKDKSAIEIEKEIIEQLKTIDKTIEEKYGEMTLENAPIVRQTIKGINTITKLSLNFQRFNEYTSKYLTHTFKVIPELEVKKDSKNDDGKENSLNNSDIVAVFKDWSKENLENMSLEEDLQEDIESEAKKQLQESRDELLTAD